ncbi:uncharacterized protein LOC135613139 isoform X1 [Musa acuminata AAA Group]|uniref:uncharacterized protein LOC135613139 isoform X1 n=1 Tax=Musa acuminata AAA Group TaxID=214697 RepID=UPI0031DB9015
MQIQEEIKVDHKDRCSGVPIKKRLFHLSQCSFSPSQETCSISHNYQRQPNQFSVEAESSVSVKDAGLPLDTGTSPKDVINSSSASSGQRYGSDVHANHDDMELKKATRAFKGSNMEEDRNADNRPSLGLDTDKGKQLSQPGTWEMIIVDRTMEEKIATCDVSAFRGVETTSIVHLSSSKDNKYHGYNSSKQEIVKTCSLDLRQTMHDEVDSEYGSADRCVSRENWDLNVPMEVWEANLSDSVVKHAMDHRLNQSAMHLQNIDRCLVQPTLGAIASASTSGTSMVERSQYKPRLRNWRTPVDDKRGYEGGLDLQLRPPSRPELRINWGKIVPSDLSLSLTGNLSEVSCRVVKPEHCENSNQKVTEVSQHSSLKSVGIRHVNSEPCDENVHGEASSVAVLFDQESSLGRVLKSEPPEEPKEKPPSLESDDNHQLTCCTDVSPSQVKPALNSNAVVDANILNDNNPVMPGNAKIESGESTSRALDPAELSSSDVPYKADDVLTNICANQGAEGNTSKSVDIIADPIISDAKESNANMTESREIADVASSQHHESASYLKEPMTHDDLSEGSAEMDCSDNEDYTSSKLVAGDDLHMATDINNVPSATNQEGLGLPAEIQTEQFNSNEQQFDATYNLRFTTDITIPVDGDIEVKGGELGDPVPQCASEVSCDHEKKRVRGNVLEWSNELPCEYEKKVHENVTIDFTGSDGHAVMMEIHSDTKGKQIVSEEAMSLHRDESFDVSMCRDKKEMSSDLTTVLHEPPDNGVVRVSSSKRLAKPCPEAIKNHLGKEKSSEMKSNSIRPPNAIAKTTEDNVDRQQMRTRYAIASIKHPELPERDSDVSGVGNKHVDDAGKHSHEKNVDSRCKHRQITKVSSPTIRSFGQRKPISSRSISSGTEDGLIDKQRRDRMFSQRRRCSEFESKKNQDQSTDKCDSDYMNTARHSNRHLDRNSNTRYASEHNNSRKHQFSRLSSRLEVPLEVATNGSVGSASTLSRRPMGDQPYRSSCFPLWRRLPRHQEEPPLVDTRNARCLVRDVSPNKEEIMRTLHHEMVDSILYSHPTMQYGPTENDVLPRGSNISPTRRRPPPSHFYGMGSPRRWLSPGRSPEMVMNKQHPALVRHGAPPSVDMPNSPHGHLYFPEGMMVERNALPADMDEMLPVNDLDLPRPGGFLQRNTRRYDFGPHETAADYLGPVHFFADHFIDTRNHHDGRDNHAHTTLPYHVEDARHIRSSRDFDSQARDRHGNARDRLRSIVEQGEGHRCRGEQGWRDGGLHSEGLKKRKP